MGLGLIGALYDRVGRGIFHYILKDVTIVITIISLKGEYQVSFATKPSFKRFRTGTYQKMKANAWQFHFTK